MIVTLRPGFLENYYGDPDKRVKLEKVKLSSRTYTEDSQDISDANLLRNTSPTTGFYELSGILDTSGILQVSIEPSKEDLSVELYKSIYILYDDMETSSSGIAMVISLEESEYLRRTKNIIDIPGFSPTCNVELSRSSDVDKLEGPGQGRYMNIWGGGELDAYITIDSWKVYNQKFRHTSESDNLNVMSINEYGFKIY